MAQGTNFLYEFGPYILDVRERVLTREGCAVPLTPKAFETLLVLVRNSGHVVEKDDLMKQVWPDTFVEEANLTQNVFALRRILGESAGKHQYIETVPRRGYRFLASVRKVSDAAFATGRHQEGKISDVQPSRETRFLAVLPFINASADAKMEYLSDGITESIINSLSQLPRLRVISRSAVFRYKGKQLDAQQIGKELGVDAVLVGSVHSLEGRLLISTELVDVANGCQLWGAHYDREQRAILELQDEIARKISAALRLRLTGDEEQQLTKRYTENSEAYQAYLEGRYYWSKYTRDGLEQAVGYFRKAIGLDPNYALAYAGVVDCYLRLTTNYFPPADVPAKTTDAMPALETDEPLPATQVSLKLRYEWDRKAAEREVRRAIELNSSYPAAHQWYAAYIFSRRLYEGRAGTNVSEELEHVADDGPASTFDAKVLDNIRCSSPTPAEEVQIFCMIAREQIEAGNYEAACAALERWWTVGEWPRLEGLSPHSSADLLLTVGTLAGWVANTRQVPRGQKQAEELLNGAIALFEQLGSKTQSAEGRIALSLCYHREGLFDLARTTLLAALDELSDKDRGLSSVGLIRSASLARDAGRLHDALARLNEAGAIVELAGPWATGRYHLELASTFKELATAEARTEYFDRALEHYTEALYEFEAIGNHRLAAIVENNHGYLLLALRRLDEAEPHLVRGRKIFDSFGDKVRRAQVDETLAQLHIAAERFDLAEQAILGSVDTLETGGEEALFAESLTTQGRILLKLGRQREAKRVLDRAYEVATRCGDSEGAGRALLVVIEEMCEQLDDDERLELAVQLDRLLSHSQRASILERLRKCLELIAEAHACYEAQRERIGA
jgi:TolB-like protein